MDDGPSPQFPHAKAVLPLISDPLAGDDANRSLRYLKSESCNDGYEQYTKNKVWWNHFCSNIVPGLALKELEIEDDYCRSHFDDEMAQNIVDAFEKNTSLTNVDLGALDGFPTCQSALHFICLRNKYNGMTFPDASKADILIQLEQIRAQCLTHYYYGNDFGAFLALHHMIRNHCAKLFCE